MLRRIFRRKKWRDEKMMRICRSRFASQRKKEIARRYLLQRMEGK